MARATNSEEFKKNWEAVKKNVKWITTIVNHDWNNKTITIPERQGKFIKRILDLFMDIDWQIPFQGFHRRLHNQIIRMNENKCMKRREKIKQNIAINIFAFTVQGSLILAVIYFICDSEVPRAILGVLIGR